MKKISVLFVCLGNICRSPAAEAIFLNLINKKSIEHKFYVESAGTGSWHIGKKADLRMRLAAKQRNIDIKSRSRQICNEDFGRFNYIVTMDDSNFNDVINLKLKNSLSDFSKIIKIQDFSSKYFLKEVPDPYFGGDEGFDNVLDILDDSVNGFLKSIS